MNDMKEQEDRQRQIVKEILTQCQTDEGMADVLMKIGKKFLSPPPINIETTEVIYQVAAGVLANTQGCVCCATTIAIDLWNSVTYKLTTGKDLIPCRDKEEKEGKVQ